ncbi:hypothetical protein EC973_001570 [Apophysomyces ossiformis]|uniref:Uncharacterized protein n=1 Tax=Apophysomyces ossiformis TaxID=679940 RepID=A0A8H7EM98_9FUNG|nr:hypothetical protein EC973_001570 [Apophysomyces ossiformis]
MISIGEVQGDVLPLGKYTGVAKICQTMKRRNSSIDRIRSAYQEDRVKKVLAEIQKLEHRIDTKKKMQEQLANAGKLEEEEVAAVYSELSAAAKARPKISSDYLEKLRVRFLDTRELRQQQLPEPMKAIEAGSTETPIVEANATMTEQPEEPPKPENLSVADYEQLIYINAIAKRPKEAEYALELMIDYEHQPTARCFNHLMDAYANAKDLDNTVATYKRMREYELTPDVYTYSCLIKAFTKCSRLDDALVIFEKMKSSDMIPTQPIFSSLISGCLKANKIQKAWDLFDTMRLSYHQPDEVSYTLMLHACAKRGEVERALNLFEDMTGNRLFPTDVTFNVLINACAKRPDYFDEAFNLLRQMQELYGFQPDKITYNTLLAACARKKALPVARELFRSMLEDERTHGKESLISPDLHTYTNLFYCYASYDPPFKHAITRTDESEAGESDSALVAYSLIPANTPARRHKVVEEATTIFNYLASQKEQQLNTAVMTAYLLVHISQKQQTSNCAQIYHDVFEQYNVEHNAFTFSHMLTFCYNTKDSALAWKVWDDYQQFLEQREALYQTQASDAIEIKAQESKRLVAQIKEGWTDEQQRNMIKHMANTLARSNETNQAVSLLATQFGRGGVWASHPPKLKHLLPVYQKCIQLEDEASKERLVKLCSKAGKDDRRGKLGATYRRVNVK